jgi:beta-glucosidase
MHNIDELLRQMTLQEKVSMLAGSDMWHTMPVERLGVPALKVTDGPNGARGSGGFTAGVKAACFPVGIALASTWNVELVARVGQALGQEARSKGASLLLAPTVNIHRSPLNGRNFECYSEDPYLSGQMAVAYINGVQSQGVGATIKHYVCNDSEYQRNSISSEVDERTLREIYLVPFQVAIRDAHPWVVMAAYNRVNGTFASEHPELLTRILREEWGFTGMVMSDWFGAQSTAASVNAGLDLEMPGPAIWRGEKLLQAVERGEVAEAVLDESVRRLLHLIERAGAFAHPEEQPEQAIDRPEHRAIARQAAAEGIVLLKNVQHALPLQAETLQTLALIGPNAKVARIMAGGSSQVTAHYAISPFEAITRRAGAQTRVRHETGCTNHRFLPLLDLNLLASGEQEGTARTLTVEYFNSPDLSGASVHRSLSTTAEVSWFGTLPAGVNPRQFSVRVSGQFVPDETGTYTFGLVSTGLSRLWFAGQQVIDNWTSQQPGSAYFGMGSSEVMASVELVAGQVYPLVVEYGRGSASFSAVRLGCLRPQPADAFERAVQLAREAEVAIVFAGLSEEWESEGFDRPDMDLVGEQDRLIAEVAAVNPRTVVVLQTGSPVAMPWLARVSAVVQAWYPGQECGHAIADVLFGDVNPSGRLAQTFPVRLEDNPASLNYPGESGQVRYGEGIFVGYRYYEKKRIAPLFPFGFGLSYTTFRYGSLQLSTRAMAPDDTLHVSLEISNTGERAGQEVVQLYIRDRVASVQRPHKELKAFAKVQLAGGESRVLTFALTREALAYYAILKRAWVAEAGEFEVLVGSSSQDIRAAGLVVLTASSSFGGPAPTGRAKLGLQSSLAELLEHAAARALLASYFPQMPDFSQMGVVLNWKLEQLTAFAPDVLTDDVLQRLARDLEQLEV